MLATLPILASCSLIPGLPNPTSTFEPRMELPKLKGKTSRHSASGPNAPIDVPSFGLGSTDEEFGGVFSYGNGFSSIDFGYMKFDMSTTQHRALPNDWGTLLKDDSVAGSLGMEEFRLRYITEIWSQSFHDQEPLTLRLGVGGVLAHREMTFEAIESTGARRDKVRAKDNGLPYLAMRAAVDYQGFSLCANYALNPDLNFGAEFDGVQQDLELIGRYVLEDQDMILFFGYRRQNLSSSGHSGDFDFATDFVIDGFLLGFQIPF